MKSAPRIGRLPLKALLCLALMVFAVKGWAEPVSMKLKDLGHGTYRLEGHLVVRASPYEVWRVLTDYEYISNFVSSLRKSTVKDSTTDRVLLEQEALGKELFLSKRVRVLLQVTEIPYKRIDFEDVSYKDFEFYKGGWEIQSSASGLDVVYRLLCKRRFIIPNFVAKDALRKSAEGLLTEVRTEILRRKEGGSQP